MRTRATLLTLTILGLVLALASAAAAADPAAKWVQSVAKQHRANLVLVAGLTKADNGFNFDGYAKGRLVFTVPAGWTVHVAFRDATALPHSLMVVPWSTKPTAAHPKPAFKAAETPHPYTGTPKGGKAAFSFKAAKPGKYRLLCAVPGHDAAGMWDTLIVKRGAHAATAAVGR